MGDNVRYAISVTPTEELTTENNTTTTVIASEVNTTLGGSGIADITDYSGTAADQGYKDGAVNYKEAPDGAGNEVAISTETSASFVFIRNTGFVFSDATTLGVVSARLIKVTVNAGAIVIATLGPGEAIPLKALQATATIDASDVKVETVDTDGTETGGGVHNAVEYLVVD